MVGNYLDIAPIPRLLIQFVMAFWFLMAATAAEDLSSGWIGKALLIVPLIIFVVGMTNFYNFMDGINGIAGLTGVVGFALRDVCFLPDGQRAARTAQLRKSLRLFGVLTL